MSWTRLKENFVRASRTYSGLSIRVRRSELEYWKASDKTKKRINLVRAVAHGGQVIADIMTIEQRTNFDILYANRFAEASGISFSIADAKSRLPDGPPQIRRIAEQ
jgi:hypothetical protein